MPKGGLTALGTCQLYCYQAGAFLNHSVFHRTVFSFSFQCTPLKKKSDVLRQRNILVLCKPDEVDPPKGHVLSHLASQTLALPGSPALHRAVERVWIQKPSETGWVRFQSEVWAGVEGVGGQGKGRLKQDVATHWADYCHTEIRVSVIGFANSKEARNMD